MITVWDRRNEKWVNVPKSWADGPDFEDLFALEKPDVDDAAAESAPEGSVDTPPAPKKPARATTKKEGTKDA